VVHQIAIPAPDWQVQREDSGIQDEVADVNCYIDSFLMPLSAGRPPLLGGLASGLKT
jgi:hypothetical protein